MIAIDFGAVEAIAWQPDRRGRTMLGYLTFQVGGLILRGWTLHENAPGKYSVGGPRRRESQRAEWMELNTTS